jgi:hypothetical protein
MTATLAMCAVAFVAAIVAIVAMLKDKPYLKAGGKLGWLSFYVEAGDVTDKKA